MENAKNLITKIRIKINDTASFEFQDSELLSYSHEGLSMLETLLLSKRITFNISYLLSSSSVCPLPYDMLEIHKIIKDKKEIPLKDVTDFAFGYYILNNNIILPCTNVEIYYIKEFDRFNINDNITLPHIYIDYICNFAVIKALSRLEYNMENEKNDLIKLSGLIVQKEMNKKSIYQLKRYNRYAL